MKMANKRHISGCSNDLIKLTDSPMFKNNLERTECTPKGCVTGVLIDFSDSVQVPYPKELLRVGEFDDTYGIYAQQTTSSKDNDKTTNSTSSAALKSQSSIRNTKDSSPDKVNKKRNSSTVMNHLTDSPLPSKPLSNKGTPVSDSDSILDIQNLSSFSFSEGEGDGILEYDNNTDDIISPRRMSREIKQMLEHEKAQVAAKEDRKRESISLKVQKLHTLLTSPSGPVPVVSRLDHFITPLRRSVLPSSMSNATANNGISGNLKFSLQSKPSIVSTAAVSRHSFVQCQSERENYGQCHESNQALNDDHITSSPVPSEDEIAETSAVKRLSFTSSISSLNSSPPTSVKTEPLFYLRKETIATSSSKRFHPSKPIVPVKGIRPFQPLKATMPLPSAAYKNTSDASISNPEAGKRAICASAPVTRKFIPPIATSSPSQASKQRSLSNTTPTREINLNNSLYSSSNASSYLTPSRKGPGRHSFTNVRSSGYGKQSPTSSSLKMVPASPKFIPTPRLPTTPARDSSSKQVMGVKGQIPSFNYKEDSAKTISKSIKAPVLTSGLRRPSFAPSVASKENKPLTSTLPRLSSANWNKK